MTAKQKRFNVYRNGRLVDSVFYSASANVTTDEVRKSLIEHDGYHPSIVVREARQKQKVS
jgi:hypothetical protein